MIIRPDGMGGFEFSRLASLRVTQLLRGCVPRVASATHKAEIVAQQEVAAGRVVRQLDEPTAAVVSVST